jgi:NitT/TauT family transport system substrate-binding protein
MKLKLLIAAIVLVAGLFLANKYLNQTPRYREDSASTATPKGGVRQVFTVGFLPVTCHLTCPVTSWVSEHSDKGTQFQAQKFTDFPSMKEALIARKLDATFMIAPLAMKLVSDGTPVKIVYLGHRDGSALVVAKDSPITDFKQLAGKTIAIPSRFSNQNLFMNRMMKQQGMALDSITLKELPPPEMPAAMAAKAIDGYIVGEPHVAKAEMEGYGRVLMQMRDAWPGFISCVLVVRQEVIDQNRPLVEELVRGIATSGKWLDADADTGAQHRKDAALVVGTQFYNQKPELLEYALTKPVDRVSYTDLVPPKDRFDEIMDLALEMKVLPRKMKFEEYCDTSFAPDLSTLAVTMDHLPAMDAITASKK